ncbi:MAG: aspartyl protease family protein [bacterium]|jgi:hypothetical protein
MNTVNSRRLMRALEITALMGALIWAGTATGQNLTDPQEILGGYLEASGGLMRLKAERTQYFEGTISVAGMEGPIRAWTEKPHLSRVEVELGPLNITQGDNGEATWILDANGKLQVTTKMDEATAKRREVQSLMAEYEYADPGSDIFSLALEGTEEIEGVLCYVVKITNTINSDYYIYYIGVDEFRLEKSTSSEGENSADTYFGDYREVDGLMVAFYSKETHLQTGQTQEVNIATYESNPVIDHATFDPPEEGGKDYEFASGNSAENLPFKFIENHLFIPVTVGDRTDLWILDTGAGMSVIDQAFADDLGLATEGNLKGQGAGGTVDIAITTLPPFELEGVSFNEQKVAVIDLAELIRRIGIESPGILGFDFLSRFVTKIDFANELISFYDPDSFTYSGTGTPVDLHMKEGVFETHATLDGHLSGTWLFDIGASSLSLNASRAVRKGYTEKKGVLRMAHGATHEYQVKGVRGEKIEFGGFILDDPVISFRHGVDDTTIYVDRLGILGNTIFRNFVVFVDYANEQVILEKGDKFNQPWPQDHSGLNIGWTMDHGGVEVIYVSPDTPAEAAGFKKGDILKSVDGAPVEPEADLLAVRSRLHEPVGTTLEIVVDREGKSRTLSLTLADLYE